MMSVAAPAKSAFLGKPSALQGKALSARRTVSVARRTSSPVVAMAAQKKVAILMGSPNDMKKMQPAEDILRELGFATEMKVMSAHRTPGPVVELVSTARENGYCAFICGAGMAAHLAGVVAAHTTLPVVGVPVSGGAINGVDALYSTVQMPKGIPVATVAIDGAMNAGILVAQMYAIQDPEVAKAIADHRTAQRNALGFP